MYPQPPLTINKDFDGFPFPVPGAEMVKFAQVTYQTASGTSLFTLPNNAEITGWLLNVSTVFNAATTNTLDIGISGAQTQFATTLALGATGQLVTGFAVSQLGIRLPGQTTVTVRYNQTGTAATTGVSTLFVRYIIR